MPGLRNIIADDVIFSLGYTLSAALGVGGIAGCSAGHSGSCPLILSFVPVVGPMTAVAWSAAATPPASVGDANTYLFIGAAFVSALQVLGGALVIQGVVRERHAIMRGARVERPQWALTPGPGGLGVGLVVWQQSA